MVRKVEEKFKLVKYVDVDNYNTAVIQQHEAH